jgi:hypothetical protein
MGSRAYGDNCKKDKAKRCDKGFHAKIAILT